MTATRGLSQATRILAIVDVNAPVQEWAASILSLTRSGAEVLVLAGSQVSRARRLLADMPVQVEGWTLSQAVEHLAAGAWQLGLIVTAPTILPPDPFAGCETIFGRDPRIASVRLPDASANTVAEKLVPKPPSATVSLNCATTVGYFLANSSACLAERPSPPC